MTTSNWRGNGNPHPPFYAFVILVKPSELARTRSQAPFSFPMLVGKSLGSPGVARERLELLVSLTVGILAVCGAILYQGAIWRSQVHAILSPTVDSKTASLLMWEYGGDHTSLSHRRGRKQPLPLNSNAVTYLTKECFVRQMASLIEKRERSEEQNTGARRRARKAVVWRAL